MCIACALALVHKLYGGSGRQLQAPFLLPSSFDVATAAQASIGAAGLAAAWLWQQRSGQRQRLQVDRRHASLEFSGYFAIDGQVPAQWDKLSGLYACGSALGQPGWMRVHANSAHHRDAALQALGIAAGERTPRDTVTLALQHWAAQDVERAATDAGGVVAAVRSFAEWDAQPQSQSINDQPVVSITPIATGAAPPRCWPAGQARHPRHPACAQQPRARPQPRQGAATGWPAGARSHPHPGRPGIGALPGSPMAPTCCWSTARTCPTSRPSPTPAVASCRRWSICAPQTAVPSCTAWRTARTCSCRATGPARRLALASAPRRWRSNIPASSWRRCQPMASVAPGPADVALLPWCRPGPASTWPKRSPQGPPSPRPNRYRCWTTLQAICWPSASRPRDGVRPRWVAAGSWQVQVTLAGVSRWLRAMGQDATGLAAVVPEPGPWLDDSACGFGLAGAGTLRAMRHVAVLSATPARWLRPSMPPRSHPVVWL